MRALFVSAGRKISIKTIFNLIFKSATARLGGSIEFGTRLITLEGVHVWHSFCHLPK